MMSFGKLPHRFLLFFLNLRFTYSGQVQTTESLQSTEGVQLTEVGQFAAP